MAIKTFCKHRVHSANTTITVAHNGRSLRRYVADSGFITEVDKLFAMANLWFPWWELLVLAPHYVIAAEQIKVPKAYYKVADYSGLLQSRY